MADTKTPLEADCSYHIYNHAVGNEKLFKSEENYFFFLSKINQYLIPYLDIYAYCLIPNHFHLVVRIKNETEIYKIYQEKKGFSTDEKLKLQSTLLIPKIISRQFSHFFNSYAQAYNKENRRKGSLFANRFKRIQIKDEQYLKKLIIYVQKNPVNHGLVDKPRDWTFSSYNSIISGKTTLLIRDEVVEIFEDLENFKFSHL